MDLNLLKAFVTVAEAQSFSEAAEALYLTQPAVSKRISSLENTLDARLFDRIGRTVHLTEAGRALMPRAQRILLELEDTRRAISNLSGEVSGKLSVGTSHHIGLHRLPPCLREFSRLYPNVQLDIRFIDSEEAYEGVQHGDLEMGIVTLPPDGPGPLNNIKIWHDPLVFVAAPDHPLAALDKIQLEQLSQHTSVLPSRSTFTRRIVEDLFDKRKLVVEVAISTNYLETIRMMSAIGLGWSVLPASMLDESIVKLPVEEVTLYRSLGCVLHPNRSLSNGGRALLQLLEAESKTAGAS